MAAVGGAFGGLILKIFIWGVIINIGLGLFFSGIRYNTTKRRFFLSFFVSQILGVLFAFAVVSLFFLPLMESKTVLCSFILIWSFVIWLGASLPNQRDS